MSKTLEQLMEKVQPRDEIDWRLVESIVEGYTERHPEIMALVAAKNAKVREDMKTAFGDGNTQSNMRYVYEMPQGLKMGLSTLYPRLFEEANLREFLKRFSIFQVPEKL